MASAEMTWNHADWSISQQKDMLAENKRLKIVENVTSAYRRDFVVFAKIT